MSGHVFISYSRADRAYVEKLVAFLEAAGIPCWYDHELATGDRWAHVIRAEIDRCAAFMVVMTPAAEESKWVSRELTRADGSKPIFPLLLAGEPFFELSEVQFEDVTGERLPGVSIVNRLRSLVTVASDPVAPPPPTVRPTVPRVSGRLLHTLAGHTHKWVRFVGWSPDGTRLATACEDMTSRIWDAATGTMLRMLTGHLGSVPRCAWSPDGAHLATTSSDRTVRIWNIVTGACVHTLSNSTVQVTPDLLNSASYPGPRQDH